MVITSIVCFIVKFVYVVVERGALPVERNSVSVGKCCVERGGLIVGKEGVDKFRCVERLQIGHLFAETDVFYGDFHLV